MVNYRRVLQPGGTYFFTVTLQDRSSRLLVERVDLLRESFEQEQQRHPFRVDAIVILPDHFHAVLTLPEHDADYAGRLKRIKAGFTRRLESTGIRLPRSETGEVRLWQRRYWEHVIRNEQDMRRHVDYIHYNPVKHGLVAQPMEWEWSSIHRFMQRGMLSRDWGASPLDDGGRYGE